jgi:hypothetical protein
MFKSITLAAVVIAASASIASANGSYRNGQIGKLLGTEAVKTSGNPHVDVEITPSFGDAVAVLKVGGNIVDTQVLNFSQHN